MKNAEFYNSIKKIADHKNTVALINIKEFRRLTRIKGEYQWIPFTIGNLPALPVITTDFKEQFRSTKERVSIRITPIWNFLTNGKEIITPNIEMFALTEYSNSIPRYMITRKIAPNRHYHTNNHWQEFGNIPIQKENAVEWVKKTNATLLSPVEDETLYSFLNRYQDELLEFNKLYEESAEKVLEIKGYQKRLHRS